MQRLNKINILLVILLISTILVIPFNEKNPNEVINTQPPQESSVYNEDTTGYARDVYVSGDYAYVADGYSGLAVIDISDPTNPKTPVYEVTSGGAQGVYIDGDYAYVACFTTGLAVIDISSPKNPGTPVYENTNGAALDVYVNGDYAYVADNTEGLAIIDISDPTNPGTPVYEDTIGTARGVYVSGDYAYVADYGSFGLAVIDISDPTNPGTPVYKNVSAYVYNLCVDGDYAYLSAFGNGLVSVDISDPTNPGTPVYEYTYAGANNVYVSGDNAYVADYTAGLAVIDISDPTNPGTPVYEDTIGEALSVYVSGDYAYIADGYSGLSVIDISEPISPGTPVYEDTSNSARGVYINGNYAYMADAYSGLAVIDISDPTNPGTPVYEDTTGYASDVFVSGDYVYVADYDGLAVIDISDPTNPGTPVYEATSGNSYGVYVSGDYAYVADGDYGLAVIDISDPTNPGTPIYEDTSGTALGIYVSGDRAYIADGDSGLAVIDITDPTNPGTPIYEDTTGYARGVYVSGDWAYVADHSSGLANIYIYDTTNPETPIYTDTVGYSHGVYVSGDYAYVGDYTGGLAIIDISEPTVSGATIYESTIGYGGAYKVYVSGDNAYVANGGSGLAVVQVRKRVDMTNPTVTSAPNDLIVEFGYTGENFSWTATDPNPNTYTIELQGSGIVVGPTAWTSGVTINYNIPDGFSVGSYTYTVNFTDDYGNSVIDSVTFFVIDDITNSTIITVPSDLTVELGYTEQSFSWTATDSNPDTYTIELQGLGIVAGPTTWTSGVAIVYNIPDGFSAGSYIYIVNFTDDYGNSAIDSVTFIVEDTTSPIVTSTPSDLTVELGYTGQSFSWTATDSNPDTYTIELQGSGIVAGPTSWTSGVAIVYNIPDGFSVGSYIYIVNFTDDYGNSAIDSAAFTVEDTTDPIITITPSDLTVELGYTGQSFSWTATDSNSDTYTIELQGSGIVVGPTTWTSDAAINYNILNGFSVGSYIYTVNFTDDFGNSIIDSAMFTVEDTTDPIITIAPLDLTIELGYTGYSFSWTAADANPDTYTIELQGSGIVIGPTAWVSGVAITYNIPDVFGIGIYTYNITFSDESGNSVSNTVKLTINSTPEGAIPFELIIIVSVIGGGAVIGVAVVIFIRRKRN